MHADIPRGREEGHVTLGREGGREEGEGHGIIGEGGREGGARDYSYTERGEGGRGDYSIRKEDSLTHP